MAEKLIDMVRLRTYIGCELDFETIFEGRITKDRLTLNDFEDYGSIRTSTAGFGFIGYDYAVLSIKTLKGKLLYCNPLALEFDKFWRDDELRHKFYVDSFGEEIVAELKSRAVNEKNLSEERRLEIEIEGKRKRLEALKKEIGSFPKSMKKIFLTSESQVEIKKCMLEIGEFYKNLGHLILIPIEEFARIRDAATKLYKEIEKYSKFIE